MSNKPTRETVCEWVRLYTRSIIKKKRCSTPQQGPYRYGWPAILPEPGCHPSLGCCRGHVWVCGPVTARVQVDSRGSGYPQGPWRSLESSQPLEFRLVLEDQDTAISEWPVLPLNDMTMSGLELQLRVMSVTPLQPGSVLMSCFCCHWRPYRLNDQGPSYCLRAILPMGAVVLSRPSCY